MNLKAMCALCGEAGAMEEMLRLVVAVEGGDARQQWYAHPLCVRGMFCDEALSDVCEEIEGAWA